MPTPRIGSEPVKLEYAPDARLAGKRIRRAILALIVPAVAFAIWQWVPPASHRLRTLYWQQECLKYTAVPNAVVYDEDPAAAATLVRLGPEYSLYIPNRGLSVSPVVAAANSTATVFRPHCLEKLCACTTPRITNWAFFSTSIRSDGATIFLHERTSPVGRRRLVCVTYAPEARFFTPSFISGENVCASAITPASWRNPLSLKTFDIAFDVRGTQSISRPLVRIYAGQPDPTDAAHFTIHYQMWGKDDVLDGLLLDDDSVALVARATPRPPHR
jgi:hypothetical protein